MYDDPAVRGRTQRRDPELGWGLSPTTIRRIHTQLHKAFNDAMRWGLVIRNPCDRADPPSTTVAVLIDGAHRGGMHTVSSAAHTASSV